MCSTAGCWSCHHHSLGLRFPVLYTGLALPVARDPGQPGPQKRWAACLPRQQPASESPGSWGMAPPHLDCRPAPSSINPPNDAFIEI